MKRTARILLFTAQEAGCLLIESLVQRDDLDLFVVTEQTRRDVINGYRFPMDICANHGIECVRAGKVVPALLQQFRDFSPELVLSVYYPYVIDTVVRSLAPSVNIHPGKLPHYRGRYPTPWYILNGETTFGLAIHQLDDGIDTGGVLLQAEYPLATETTGHALYRRTQELAAELIATNLDAILERRLLPRPQRGTGSYYSRIEPRFHIDWNLSAEMIARRVRVHAKPYFPAYGFVANRMLLVNRARPVTCESFVAQGGGQIIKVDPDGSFLVSASDGVVAVEDYELAPSMPAEEVPSFLKLAGRVE